VIVSLLLELLQKVGGLIVLVTKCCKEMKETLRSITMRLIGVEAKVDVIGFQTTEILSRLYSLQVDVDRILEAVVPPPVSGIRMLIVMDGQIKTGELPMSLVMTDTQQFTASVSFVDAKGNPAQVDGAPSWSVSDPTILSITPSSDGLSAEVSAIGVLGTSQVSVSADADLGAGVTNIVGVLDVQVVAGQAVAANISASTPVDQKG
jgi:hypothetical protein